MELIVISTPDAIADEAKLINDLFVAGLKRLHLRKPHWTSDQLACLLSQVNPLYYGRLSLHQHHHLASEFNIRHLHYPEQQRLKTERRTLLQQKHEGYVLSTSVHQMPAVNSVALFDHAFFGPVFHSLSKPGYESTLPDGFRIEVNNTTPQIIALGGVQANKLQLLQDMNFAGAAVLGAIWNEPEVAISNFKHFQTAGFN